MCTAHSRAAELAFTSAQPSPSPAPSPLSPWGTAGTICARHSRPQVLPPAPWRDRGAGSGRGDEIGAHGEVPASPGGEQRGGMAADRPGVCACVDAIALRVYSLPTRERKGPLAKQFTCRLAIFAKTKILKDASVSSIGAWARGQPPGRGCSAGPLAPGSGSSHPGTPLLSFSVARF